MTSFANGVGTRNAEGVWTSGQAKWFLDYTASLGGDIAAAEFMNEPNMAAMGGAPAGYDAAAYGRDFKIFHAFAKQAAADMQILGPGSVGETTENGPLPRTGIAEDARPAGRLRLLTSTPSPITTMVRFRNGAPPRITRPHRRPH